MQYYLNVPILQNRALKWLICIPDTTSDEGK